MADQVRNKIIVLEPSTKSVKDLLALLQEKDVADIISVTTAEDAMGTVVSSTPCLLITSLIDNGSVPPAMQLLKRLENTIKHQGLKVYMVTGIKNRQLSDLFTQKLGVTDYIIDPVPVRTMQFKVNLALKAVDNFRKQQEAKKAAQEQIVIKKLEGSKKPEGGATEIPAKGKPALQMAEDTFLFKNGGVKKAGKKFVLEVEGPDPSTGEWKQHEDKGDKKSAWRWVPNEEKEAQESGKAPPDGWVHEGEKPVFNEESGKWALTSEKPSLGFKKAGATVAEKISTDEKGEVVVAEDSPAAEANLQKNKLKAAVAIQQRKDAAKPKKAEEAEKSSLDDLFGSDPAAADPLAEKIDTGPKGKPKIAGKGGDAIKALLAKAESGEKPAPLNNKLDAGKTEEAAPLNDKREPAEKPKGNILELGGDEEEATAETAKPASPLDFLKKKKKEQLQKGASTIKADDPLQGANPLKDGEAPAPALVKKTPGKKGAAADKLAALRAGMASDSGGEDDSAEASSLDSLAGDDEQETAIEDKTASALQEESADEASVDLGRPKLKLKGKKKDAAASAPKVAKLKEQKKKTLEEIQARLLEPLAETMTPEEEEQAREELGLKGRPEIKVKDLARKKRLADVQKMKSKLGELDEEIAEESGEAINAGVSRKADDTPDRTRTGDLSKDKLTGIRGAFDNEEDAGGDDDSETRKKLSREESVKKKRAGIEDNSKYLPEADIQPPGNAWESSGSYYIYLNAQLRYKGFEKLEEVLPLWIFEGDQMPELLDKSKQWRFRERLPAQAKTVSEIPGEVREFLLGIRDQLREAKGEGEAEESSPAAKGEKKSAEKPGKGKAKNKDSSSKLDQLRNELAGGDETEPAPEETEAERAESRAGDAEEPETSGDSGGDEDSDSETEAGETESSAESADEAKVTAKKDKKKKKSGSADALDKLRDQLSDGEESPASSEESGEESPGEISAAEEKGGPAKEVSKGSKAGDESESSMDRLRAKLGEEEPGKPGKADNTAPEKSEAMQKFMERRKKKAAESAAKAASDKSEKTDAAVKTAAKSAHSVYLGIYVVLSDSLAQEKASSVAIPRVLKAFEVSFGNCTALCTGVPDGENNAEVQYWSPSATDKYSHVQLNSGIFEPITSADGGDDKVLGYLYLKVSSPRTEFDASEMHAVKQIARKLWPILSKQSPKDAKTAESEAA